MDARRAIPHGKPAMTIGLSYLPNTMRAVVSAASQNAEMRNQMSQQANERRGRELSETYRVMSSSFDIMSHAMTARTGMVDFTG